MGGGVAAETPDPENVSLIESETEADTLDNQEEIQLSNSITLTGWEFSGDRARIGIEAERAERIEVSDNVAGMGESGASRVPVTDQRVFTGSTVVVVPVDSFAGGHAVTVSAGGESLRLSTDMDTEGDDPFRHFGGESGLFSGMLLALFSSMAGAGFVLWREDSGVMKA
ncbi:hypothetical protein [Halorubrum vacuolatum]|nr:hypothetical protein [Halorubrum vacuolatum]